MKKSKFLYLTIKGDTLNPMDLKKDINLPCEVYIKDDIILVGLIKKKVTNKTNRWVYSSQVTKEMTINQFLITQLEIISHSLEMIHKYIGRYHSLIELVIYETRDISHFNIVISKRAQYLLNKIGIKFSITFVDF